MRGGLSGSISYRDARLWRMIWRLRVSPRIKLSVWSMCHGALPAGMNITKQISSINMSCNICGCLEGSNVHVLLKCPLAVSIWESSVFYRELWEGWFRTRLF